MNARDLKLDMIVYHAFLRGLGKGRVQSIRIGRNPHRFFVVWANADTSNWFRAVELHNTLRKVREKTLHARRKPFVKPAKEVPMKTQPPQATQRTTSVRIDGKHLSGRCGKEGISDRAYEDGAADSYSQDELDFMMAMDHYKREHCRPFPTWSEVLGVLHDAGWRKVAEPVPVHPPV